MIVAPAPSLTPTYLVGVLNFSDLKTNRTTPHGTTLVDAYPTRKTSMVFTFSDPYRAGKCLASLCKVSTIKGALAAALASGCAPSSSAAVSDAFLAGMVRRGDMWACVVYFDEVERRRTAIRQGDETLIPKLPSVCYGYQGDVNKPHWELDTIPSEKAAEMADTFFAFGQLAQIG